MKVNKIQVTFRKTDTKPSWVPMFFIDKFMGEHIEISKHEM